MTGTVFFSWQLDTEASIGRNFVREALEEAVGLIRDDMSIEEPMRDIEVDSDTKGVAGTPPIAETIFSKIDRASVYVADLTFIATRLDGKRLSPNPNVLIEYGWALKRHGHSRIILVMNTEFGEPTRESMPFNLLHLRFPITFACARGTDIGKKRKAQKALTRDFVRALTPILHIPAEPAQEKPRKLFHQKSPGAGTGRFRLRGEPIGITSSPYGFGKGVDVRLTDGPVAWLRVIPVHDPDKKWRMSEIEGVIRPPNGGFLMPFGGRGNSFDLVRNADGQGSIRVIGASNTETNAVSFVFSSGEIWGIDADVMHPDHTSPPIIPNLFGTYITALSQYLDALSKLGVPQPYNWEAGLEGVKGRQVFVPARDGYHSAFPFAGQCVNEVVIEFGKVDPTSKPIAILRPFFETLYDSCGVSLPNSLFL